MVHSFTAVKSHYENPPHIIYAIYVDSTKSAAPHYRSRRNVPDTALLSLSGMLCQLRRREAVCLDFGQICNTPPKKEKEDRIRSSTCHKARLLPWPGSIAIRRRLVCLFPLPPPRKNKSKRCACRIGETEKKKKTIGETGYKRSDNVSVEVIKL